MHSLYISYTTMPLCDYTIYIHSTNTNNCCVFMPARIAKRFVAKFSAYFKTIWLFFFFASLKCACQIHDYLLIKPVKCKLYLLFSFYFRISGPQWKKLTPSIQNLNLHKTQLKFKFAHETQFFFKKKLNNERIFFAVIVFGICDWH